MRKEIEREKEVADEYKLYKLEILEKKIDWVIKNVEDCDEEIMEKIRAEILCNLLEGYRKSIRG